MERKSLKTPGFLCGKHGFDQALKKRVEWMPGDHEGKPALLSLAE